MSASSPDDSLTPRYEASIEFLQRWCKGGPWVMVALAPDKKEIDVDTFGEPTLKGLRAWLDEWGTQKKFNVYFTVNPCVRALKTKPAREHIASLSWLHVDIDPEDPPEELIEQGRESLVSHQESERARIRDKLRNLPTDIPPPTCIIDSGGGYQAFWRLRQPELLDGTAETYEEAKRWNKQLELRLDGDNCHNVDRIMRLPGTVNWPKASKRKNGRVPALASVVEFNDSQHHLKLFEKAPKDAKSSGAMAAVEIDTANVTRFASVDDIPELRDARYRRWRVAIVQGCDPDDPGFGKTREQRRSGVLFTVCCAMVRAGCSDETIYGVITDPGFGISASVLDKGSSIESYALRQVRRAREEAIEPLLREINDEYALVTVGGKARILREHDPLPHRARPLALPARPCRARRPSWPFPGPPAARVPVAGRGERLGTCISTGASAAPPWAPRRPPALGLLAPGLSRAFPGRTTGTGAPPRQGLPPARRRTGPPRVQREGARRAVRHPLGSRSFR